MSTKTIASQASGHEKRGCFLDKITLTQLQLGEIGASKSNSTQVYTKTTDGGSRIASVLSVPATTLVSWRSAPTLPLDRCCGAIAIEPLPSATAPVAVALLQ